MNQKPGFLDTEEGKQYLIDKYVNEGQSAYTIAENLDCYENKIYRSLKKHGLPRRTKAEAQKKALEKGTAQHPVKGKPRPMAIKNKIGQKMHNYWKNIDEKALQERVDKSREIWYTVPEDTRKKWQKKAHISIRKAAKEGSKFEKFLVSAMIADKRKVEVHKKFLFENSEMSVDIYEPITGICIECDSVYHCNPIFGDEYLKNRIEKDLLKNEQLLANGYTVIRITNPKGYCSKAVFTKFATRFLKFLREVADKQTNTLHEILLDDFLED